MRATRLLIAAGAAIALVSAPVSGAPASNGDFVSGSGYRMTPDGTERRVQFNAYAQADTNGAWGTFWYHNLAVNLTFSGQVKCLDISGNQATIGGVITRTTAPELVGAGDKFLVFLIDNGDQDNSDITSQTYVLPASSGDVVVPRNFPSTCPDAGTTEHDAFSMEGDIVVGNVYP